MPKHEAGSIKAIAIRQKAKGLQKLRWYCEACQKQCRDENGFKCHQTSEGHLRAMRLFAENPGKAMADYSKEFEANFMAVLTQRHGTKRVAANNVYQEYISHRQHTHMNATRWETLTAFVQYLGKSGQCVVDETEKGWFIQWIDRSPEALKRQQANERKLKLEADDEERHRRELKRRVKAAGGIGVVPEATALDRDAHDNIAVALPSSRLSGKKPSADGSSKRTPFALDGPEHKKSRTVIKPEASSTAWLRTGIVVKVKAAGLEAYFGKKAVVRALPSPYSAVVRMLDSGDDLQLDQDDLETVIPNIGRTVTLLKGAHAGQLASVRSVDVTAFAVALTVLPGQPDAGLSLDNVLYEDISKTADPSCSSGRDSRRPPAPPASSS